MEEWIREQNGIAYIDLRGSGILLDSEQTALNVLAEGGEHDAPRLLVDGSNLPADFFDLSTGLAGAILQKFAVYFVRCATVLTPEQVGKGRFYEMVLEANRGQLFRVYPDSQLAIAWLTSR
jgi:hypothetical protein